MLIADADGGVMKSEGHRANEHTVINQEKEEGMRILVHVEAVPRVALKL